MTIKQFSIPPSVERRFMLGSKVVWPIFYKFEHVGPSSFKIGIMIEKGSKQW